MVPAADGLAILSVRPLGEFPGSRGGRTPMEVGPIGTREHDIFLCGHSMIFAKQNVIQPAGKCWHQDRTTSFASGVARWARVWSSATVVTVIFCTLALSPATATAWQADGAGLVDPAAIDQRRSGIESETVRTKRLAAALAEGLESLNERIEMLGLNEGNRLLLEERRRTLPSASASRARIAWVQQEMRQLNLELLRVEQMETEEATATEPAVRASETPAPKSLVMIVHDSLHAYSLALGNLAAEHNFLLDQIEENEIFLNRQLLWVPSADPVSLADFGLVAQGSRVLMTPRPWMELGKSFVDLLKLHPWRLAVVVGMVVGVGLAARQLELLMNDASGKNAEVPQSGTSSEKSD